MSDQITDQEKQEIRVFWWGRKLPVAYSEYVNLSSLDDESFRKLKRLKEVWEMQNKPDWGQQLRAEDLGCIF